MLCPIFIIRGSNSTNIEFLFNKANILIEHAMEVKYEERDKVLKELKKEYEIVQELTEDSKKVAEAVASLKTLEN